MPTDRPTCPACGKELPTLAERTRLYTCDAICHAVWLEQLVIAFGETQRITDLSTGLTHLVPTRVIYERGISAKELPEFPVATS